MTHIDYNSKTRAERTTGGWLQVGAHISELANTWAERNDLVAFIGEGATEGLAPALFKPEIAEIEINVDKAFGFGVTPEQIGDIRSRASRYEFPKATGAVLHEAFHARFSRWSISDAHAALQSDEFAALMLLEEGRIEALGLKTDSKHRVFLRACAFDIVLSDLNEKALEQLTVASAAQLVGLVQARVVAGILEEDAVAEITNSLCEKLGEENFNRLSEIAAKFQQHINHYSIVGAYPLAIEWAQIVRDVQQEQGENENGEGEGEGAEGEGVGTPASGEGKSAEGESEGEGSSKVTMKSIIEKIKDAAEESEIKNTEELYDQERQENWNEQVEDAENKSKQINKNKEVSESVFCEGEGAGTGEVSETRGTYSNLIEERAPKGVEHAAAVTVARMLEKAKYRERDLTIVTSQVPQGKLRTRAAIQNAAQKAQGQMPTANPWKQKVRKQTDEPKLTVGVMVDISGSMRSAMEPMATTAWVMSEATRRVQGQCAMVYYGQDVFPTLKKGQHLNGVRTYSANDPTEKFDKAFRALDGSLNLLNGNGVRLLVVVSDGVYTDAEDTLAKQWMERCKQNGVAVLWLTFQETHNSHADRICKGTDAVVLSGRLNPADAAVEIGRAAAKALEISTNRAA
jgi:hypothetical protein